MNPITVNYGITGGMLDASKHLEAAIPRLLTGAERSVCERRACLLGEATTTAAVRAAAPLN